MWLLSSLINETGNHSDYHSGYRSPRESDISIVRVLYGNHYNYVIANTQQTTPQSTHKVEMNLIQESQMNPVVRT